MTREELSKLALSKVDKANCLVLNLATGTGKTKIAIECTNKICDRVFKREQEPTHVLILVSKTVHKDVWKKELDKWGIKTDCIIIECYESLHKYEDAYFDVVICDECFRGDTEILTDKGYKQFKDLNGTELVAQFTDEGNIEFVKPIRYIKKPYIGKICKMHLGRDRYVYLTPNHNQVYRTKAIKEWRLKPVKDIKENCITKIPVSGRGTGNNSLLSPLEQLFIAIQADGTLSRHQKNESVYSIQVTKDRKKKRLLEILEKTHNYTKIKGRPECDRYLVKLPKGDAKLLSTHFNINMGYERANSFIDEIVEWDGSKIHPAYYYYSSKIKENADFVAAVAIQAGYKVLQSIEKDNRKDSYCDIHRVFMRKQEDINTQRMHKEYIDYDDDIYCVEVPSHKIVVRSEGYSFISGNCQHLSEARQEILKTIHIQDLLIVLSATLKKELCWFFKANYKTEFIKCDIKEAIEDDVLPEPTIYLLPLKLDNKACTYKYDRFKKTIIGTQLSYYNNLCSLIEFYKNKYMSSKREFMKTLWLRACNDRLKWLSEQKESVILSLLDQLKNYRTLTFCSSIDQTERLGKYCINSKNKKSVEYLDMFNNKKIKHITSCNILNESVNLVDCRIGIFCNLNASDIIVKQRNGRLLRHKNPVIIVPYYEHTREAELVDKIIENYNEDRIITIHDINEIKL